MLIRGNSSCDNNLDNEPDNANLLLVVYKNIFNINQTCSNWTLNQVDSSLVLKNLQFREPFLHSH